MITAAHVYKYFGEKEVLDDINLSIRDHEFFCLIGTSGQGKSVLLQHLVGLMQPDSGAIAIDGVDITRLLEQDLLKLRRQFGYLFQDAALFDYMTVYENLALKMREHSSLSEEQIDSAIAQALEQVELNKEEIQDKLPSQLSGGMKKRVGIARAIIGRPGVLFCDEPTSGLDPHTAATIAHLLSKLCRTLRTTTIVVSHDVRNFFPLADTIAVIEAGKIIAAGSRADIENSQNPVIRKLLLKD